VSEWLRVGYVQGNMNSDNTLAAGRTIDYGPFGWLERFDPTYQPFTSDLDGKFSFLNQPRAMAVNMAVLGKTIEMLITYVTSPDEMDRRIQEVRQIGSEKFEQDFGAFYRSMRRRKLGLTAFTKSDRRDNEEEHETLWCSLLALLQT
jgi:uncharacterized protein YdiU (UPF0061 family)